MPGTPCHLCRGRCKYLLTTKGPWTDEIISTQDAIPKGTLNAAVEQLIKDVRTKVLGKRKIREGDSVAINNGVELDCNIFRRLRDEEWFDAWTIVAAMQITDKPFFVHHGYSVPLEELGRNGRMKPVKRPLSGWARKIVEFRKNARETFGNSMRLVYFCPLNHGDTHFTLLEINEREEVIRHYDSMADKGVIDGTMRLTRVQRLVKVRAFLSRSSGENLT